MKNGPDSGKSGSLPIDLNARGRLAQARRGKDDSHGLTVGSQFYHLQFGFFEFDTYEIVNRMSC
jgi:hypothetical protein